MLASPSWGSGEPAHGIPPAPHSPAPIPCEHTWYDAFDRRISRRLDTNGDGTYDSATYWAYDSAGKQDPGSGASLDDIVLEFNDADGDGAGAATLSRRYLHGPAVDQVLASEDFSTGTVNWALADEQGTIRDVARYSGATTTIVTHRKFDAFGNLTSETNPGGGSPVPFLFSFTGREWDADAEMYHYRARWYDARVGRFASEDPLGFSGGDTNLNRYVGNSPVNGRDPSGLREPPAGYDSWEDYWKQKTIRDAGLTRLIGPDGLEWWLTWDSSDAERNREILVLIYNYYGETYKKDRDRFLYMGLAAHAGSQVVTKAIDRIERERLYLMDELDLSPIDLAFAIFVRIGGPVTVGAEEVLILANLQARQDMQQVLTMMAMSIFMDLAWEHAAYMDGGLPEMKRLLDENAITKKSYRAFEWLDSGKPDQIEAATEYFVKREQLQSLHDGYEIISGFMGGEIAKRMSDEAESGLPHTMSFRFMFPDESFADFREDVTNPRLIWIRNWALMPWLEYSPLKRDGLVEQALEKINSPEWKFQRKKPLETDLW